MNAESLGPFLAFMSSVTWAVGATGYSRLSQTYSPYAINFTRAIFSFPIFVLAVFAFSGGWHGGLESFAALKAVNYGWLFISMVASYAVGDIFFMASAKAMGVPGALAIASSYPIFNSLASSVFEGERLGLVQIAGLLITVLGVVLVILNGPRRGDDKGSGRNWTKGILYGFATAVFWALNSLAIAKGGHGVSPFAGNAFRMIVAACLCACFGRYFYPKERVMIPGAVLLSTSWLFFVEAVLGSLFFMYGLSHSTMAIGSTLSSLAPVISVPVAWALGMEKFSFYRTLGVILVVAGICLLVGGSQIL